MNIVDGDLEKTLKFLCENHSNELPFDNNTRSYFDRYSEMAGKLNRDFHDKILAGSSAFDGGMLTDHGPDHIRTVIQRAGAILDKSE